MYDIGHKIIREIYSLLFSNHIHLNYRCLPINKNSVNLHRYISGLEIKKHGSENLGDYISEIIVNWMLKEKNLSLDFTKTTNTKHLYAIGSILLMGHQNATIWGTGMPFEPSMFRGLWHNSYIRKLDIRCCRGPLTRKTLLRLGHNCPEKYGDPAVLLPLIYKPPVNKDKEYLIIPHYSQYEDTCRKYSISNILNMETTNYKFVVESILRSKKVVSSSLHGIILAESYGIPAVFYQDRHNKFNYKYKDWYLSTNRDFPSSIPTSIEKALDFSNLQLPELCDMRQILINTFPYDLWLDK